MNSSPYRYFSAPSNRSLQEQVDQCVSIVRRYQAELPQLRRATSVLKRQKKKSDADAAYWKHKYEEEKQKNGHLEKENEQLKDEIEKVTKTTNRYRASLFDHGNFQSPTLGEKKKKG